MCSLLSNIKSKYSLKNIFDYLYYNITLKLIYGSKQLMHNLDITKEAYKQLYEIKNVLEPSYNIEKYLDYLNKNKIPNLNEQFIYECFNKSTFNIDLFIGNNRWENILKNIHKINLVINPNLLYYINESSKEKQKNIFNLLKKYKSNIIEISFFQFINDWKINFDIIEHIIYILNEIFNTQEDNRINLTNKISHDFFNDNIDKKINIKKLSLGLSAIHSYVDIANRLFDRIDQILSLNKIEELYLDSNMFNEYQFTNFMNYISKKMKSLKYLKISNFGFNLSNYADLKLICSNVNEHIEKIDLSDSVCSNDIISILNSKNYPLKEIKFKLYSNENDIKWTFLEKSINTLEVFNVEIQVNNNHDITEEIINILNKMEKLKHLKLIGSLTPKELFNFQNKSNLEYLDIDINLLYNNIELFPVNLYDYFKDYNKLKSLTITKKDSINNISIKNDISLEFIFPPGIKFIKLVNFEDIIIIPLLLKNKNNLTYIEEFKFSNCHFTYEKLIELIDLFSSFKSLMKLSLNKIDFKVSPKLLLEDVSFYEYIPQILKNIPSLIELDICNNEYTEKILKSKTFIKIKESISKKLFSFKIFNNEINVSDITFTYLTKLFGTVLDYDNYRNVDNSLLDDSSNEYEDIGDDYNDY